MYKRMQFDICQTNKFGNPKRKESYSKILNTKTYISHTYSYKNIYNFEICHLPPPHVDIKVIQMFQKDINKKAYPVKMLKYAGNI